MKILVIRRDNIGDLVCTTPIFPVLREYFPTAHIAALVNNYNSPVLHGNPNLDAIHVYQKAKHRKDNESKISIWINTLKLVIRLRRQHFDYAIIATANFSRQSLKFAYGIKARHIIAHAPPGTTTISDPIDNNQLSGLHEAEIVFQLLAPLGISTEPGPLQVFVPDNNLFSRRGISKPNASLIGLHISARLTNQRWPIERFSNLSHSLHHSQGVHFLVFWSPGSSDNPLHPGDDEKAQQLLSLCGDIPLTLFHTEALEELIIGMDTCDLMICSDGGALHVAAGLGKPIMALFGNLRSDAVRHHPWKVPYKLLQKESGDVIDISTDEAIIATSQLLEEISNT